MRALPLAALGFAALLLAPLAAAEEPIRRFSVEVGYPLPSEAYAGLLEDPGCMSHQLLWQGLWFAVADPVRGLAEGSFADGLGSAAGRLLGTATLLGDRAVLTAVDAFATAGPWVDQPFASVPWALGQVGDKDTCTLGLVEAGLGPSPWE